MEDREEPMLEPDDSPAATNEAGLTEGKPIEPAPTQLEDGEVHDPEQDRDDEAGPED